MTSGFANIVVLSARDVDSIASHFTPNDLQLLMAQVFSQVSNRNTQLRDSIPLLIYASQGEPSMLNHTALVMPARMGGGGGQSPSSSSSPGNSAIKVVSVPHDSSRSNGGLPGTVVLDENTGSVKAIVNARKFTALRNAAGSLLSTTLLAVSQPESIVAFGACQQIGSHLDLFLRHFPLSLKHCTIVNRSRNDRALSLHKRISDKFSVTVDLLTPVMASGSDSEVKRALGATDIVICTTSSTAPLFPSSYARDGTHIILIGRYKSEMKEVDRDLISRSLKGTPLIDSTEACLITHRRLCTT